MVVWYIFLFAHQVTQRDDQKQVSLCPGTMNSHMDQTSGSTNKVVVVHTICTCIIVMVMIPYFVLKENVKICCLSV